jgi:hypothetical protein
MYRVVAPSSTTWGIERFYELKGKVSRVSGTCFKICLIVPLIPMALQRLNFA